jgi:hypothetical protein
LTEWTDNDLPALADLGYEGEPGIFTLPIKKPKNAELTQDHKQLNRLQAHARARAEQANAVLKMTFKALRHVSLDPGVIGLPHLFYSTWNTDEQPDHTAQQTVTGKGS